MSVCPKKCIVFEKDLYGSLCAVVKDGECIQCKKCIRTCPVNTAPMFKEPKVCYAAWDSDSEKRNKSASGGAAGIIAEYGLKKDAIVYGAAFYQNKFQIIRVDSLHKAELLRGSKYVQCMTEDSYRNVQNDLNEGKDVVYFGTPCQIAGLLAVVGKYPHLLTIDLVCHGTPPVSYLEDHVLGITKRKLSECDDIIFRRDGGYKLEILLDGNVLYSKPPWLDDYYKAFQEGVTCRKNCYSCAYAKGSRISDITLGDFWGLGKEEQFDYPTESVSLVLVNSNKGRTFLEGCKRLVRIERKIEEAVAGNSQLREPTVYSKDAERFHERIKATSFRNALRSTDVWKSTKRMRILSAFVFLIKTLIPSGISKIKKRV